MLFRSQATALSEYPAKIAAITSGGETPGGGVPAWTAPDDWIQLGTPNDNEILLLASDIYLSNCFQVTCVGGYTIDWGDGITESFDSGTRCYHNYIEGTGRGCSRGYTTFKIRIYSQNGVSPITAFIVKGITNSIDTTANSAILWAKLGTRGLTTASGMFFDSFSYYTCAHLEKVTLPNELPNCVYFTDTFKNATALEEVDMPTLYSSNPISFKGTFERCYNLTHFDFKAESLQISTMELMFSYAGISDVVLPGTVLGCSSFKTMFSYTSIRTLVLPIIDTPTNLDFMFSNCFALNEVVFNSSWNNNISTQSQAFTSCAAIRELVDYPDLIPPALGGVSLFSNLTGATRMRMPSSSGSLVSAQIGRAHV